MRKLFTLGSKDQTDQRVKNMAFGSLLHMVQDSFSKAHVERQGSDAPGGHWPGRVKEFHAYALQDHKRHSDADERESFQAADTKERVVGSVRRVVDLRGKPWSEMGPLIAEIFDVVDRGSIAGPGDRYRYVVAPVSERRVP